MKKELENYLKRALMLLLAVTVGFATVSCDEDEENEPEATETVYEIISANSELSTLKTYIDADSELLALTQGTTEHTVFLADNEAFKTLEGTLGGSLELVSPAIVAAVLRFHFSTTVVDNDGIPNASIPTLQGESIIGNPDGTILTGGSVTNVEVSNSTAATNGETHVVGNVLIPPSIFLAIGQNLGKLSQPIFLAADFTTMAAAVTKADGSASAEANGTITAKLTGSDLYTLFAVPNAVFESAEIGLDDYDADTWYAILSHHLFPAASPDDLIGAEDLVTCASFTSAIGQPLEVFYNLDVLEAQNGIGIYFDSNGDVDCTLEDQGASLVNLDAELAAPNAFEASNGVMHVIAGVFVPALQ